MKWLLPLEPLNCWRAIWDKKNIMMTWGILGFSIIKQSKDRGFIAINQKKGKIGWGGKTVFMKGKNPHKTTRKIKCWKHFSSLCYFSASWLKSAGTAHVSFSYESLLDVEIETKSVCLHQVQVTYFGNQSVRIELWKHDYFTHQFSFKKTSYLISQKCHPHVRLSRTLAHVMKQCSSAHNDLIVLSD